MRIVKIEAKNYRQYQDLSITFDNKRDCDIHVIIASNGVGKTNFANAISWCLYGTEPSLNAKSKTLPIVNLSTLKENNYNGVFPVEVKIILKESDKNIIFNRTEKYKFVDASTKPYKTEHHFCISEEKSLGKYDTYHGEDYTKAIVNKYFPEKISEYFFFDGERLDDYFSKPKSTSIKEAVDVVSQVGLLDTVGQRFKNIQVDYRSEISKNSPEISKNEEVLSLKQDSYKNTNDTILQLWNQINISDAKIKEISHRLQGITSVKDKETRRIELEKLLTKEEERLKDANRERNLFIVKYYPKMKLLSHIQKLKSQIDDYSSKGLLPPKIDLNLLREIIDNQVCSICESDLDYDKINHIHEIINKISVTSDTSNILSGLQPLVDQTLIDIQEYAKIKEQILRKINNSNNEIKTLDEELGAIKKELLGLTNIQEVIDLENDRLLHSELRDQNMMELGKHQEILKNLEKDIKLLEKELDRAFKILTNDKKMKDLYDIATKAFEIINSVKSEITSETRELIQLKTKEMFEKLIWKTNTYSDLLIDENYEINVIHMEGYSCLESLGAAERALLTLSFTIAMQEVSGFHSPLVIDTPVARISDRNRENFANMLLNVSRNKQIILLFTPSEFSEEIKNILGPVSGEINFHTEDEIVTEIA